MPDRLDNDFFIIDPERLDEQWFGFAAQYYDYACKLADARVEHERTKARRDVIAAELDREIRQDPAAFGLTPGSRGVTETMVEKTILLSKKYRKVEEDVIIAKHTVDILYAAIEALDGKKKGLENAVQLRLANYFSEPRVKGDSGSKMTDTKIDRALGARRNRE